MAAEPAQIRTSVAPTGTSAHAAGYSWTPAIHQPHVMIRPSATTLSRFRIRADIASFGIHTASRPPASGSHRRATVS